jgi:1,4-alpha-glucan branching enzyme
MARETKIAAPNKGAKAAPAKKAKAASTDWRLDHGAISAIVSGDHGDPFAVLGLQQAGNGFVARAFIVAAENAEAFDLKGKSIGVLTRRDPAGFFEGEVALTSRQPIRYKARRGSDEWWVTDAYSFGPVLGPMDDYYISEGSHLRLFDKLGAHQIEFEGVSGVHFAVWAPNARRVSVVGDFNGWDGRRHVMRCRTATGIWEIFVPDLEPGTIYKYEIASSLGGIQPLKADPYAFQSELRPKTASVVAKPFNHQWGDQAHRQNWRDNDQRRVPVSIYEVHAGSWKRADGDRFLTWDEMAADLIPYCVDMGFTHIEFLPISEHPFDPSWGYQTTGLYAPSARFGEPEGFARFVDGAHRAGLGVILDWVPAHFPVDAHGLNRFDGTALYEHEDPRQGFHPDWNTAIYNFGRKEVMSFLVNNALFWCERYHVDALRVDAVASMLYLDYSRKEGEWVPNKYGGRENLETVDFLRAMNKAVYGTHPGSFTIAEESTAWPKVSAPVHEGGLGFGFKWNMGFMHDTLQYLQREPVYRKHHHNELTFGLLYAFGENYVLPLSHDEVVHGKGSLLKKMAGPDLDKFAQLRAYYGFMWGYPGKKLLFMGQELAPWEEWSEARSLDWHLAESHLHGGMQRLVKDLNHTYRNVPALHQRDCEGEGFEWLIADDAENSVYAWLRKAPGQKPVAVVTNFTPVERNGYRVPFPREGRWREIVNTDAPIYGGQGRGNMGAAHARKDEQGIGALLTLPPLSTIMFECEEA